MIKQMTTVASLGVLLSACSASNPFVSANTANVVVKPPIGVVKSMYAHQSAKVQQQVEQVPSWYTKMPVKDDAIYAVGTANTPDLQLSNDIAILSAKTTLADRINGRVNSITKSFITKVGSTDADASVMNEIQTATKNIISDVDVAGYNVQESKVVSNGTQYRVYVLLEYSDENAQKILLNRLKKDKMLMSKIKSNEAFKELDETVNQNKVDEIKKLDKIIDAEKLS